MGQDKLCQYLSNKAKIRDRLTVVQIIMIETPLFDCWCDNGSIEA